MSSHYVEKCVHGAIGGQCRCPSPNKSIKSIPCPPSCTAQGYYHGKGVPAPIYDQDA